MTNVFKLTNCILALIVVLLLCTYTIVAQNVQQEVQMQNYLMKTVAAFNA